MKTLLKYIPLGLLALLLGCSSSQNNKFTVQQQEELDALIEAKSYEFVARWARPLTTSAFNQIAAAGLLIPGSTPNNIDLTGNFNYFRVVGDSVYAYLPYYGERQMGAVYPGTDNSIHFKGVPNDFSMERNEKGYKFSFTINDKTETYQINAQWFPSKTGNININSSQRFPIAYSGQFDTFEPKQ